MINFYISIVNIFLISFGIVLGASVFSGIGAILTNNPPYKAMMEIANSVKLWAMAAALGGTFSSFSVIDKGLFEGEIKSLIKQIMYIVIALLGANGGNSVIRLIARCNTLWRK